MSYHHSLCFVIADDGRARFVRSAGADSSRMDEAIDSARMSMIAPLRFSHFLGERVREESDADAFVLVAPPHILNEIIDRLDGPTKTCLSGTLASDLTDVPDEKLWPHLSQWMRG